MSDENKLTDTTATDKADPAADAAPEKFGRRRMPAVAMDVAKVRTLAARIVWGLCALFAGVLAATVLLIAIDANAGNDLVTFLVKFADKVDLHYFDLTDPIKDFDTKKDASKDVGTALFNYGIAAIVWLVVGRVLDRLIRP